LYLRLAWIWDFAGIKAAIGASSGIGGAVRSLGRHGALLEGEFLFQILGSRCLAYGNIRELTGEAVGSDILPNRVSAVTHTHTPIQSDVRSISIPIHLKITHTGRLAILF
jgi:hypothetical protein